MSKAKESEDGKCRPYDGEIIDCHIHPALQADEWTGWFAPFQSPEEQVNDLRCAGISRVCGRTSISRACGSVIRLKGAPDWAAVEALNRSTLALCDRFPDFFIPGMHVHPKYPDESCREIERLHGEGVRWIGELVGYMMGYADGYDSKGAFAIFAEAEKRRMPVNFHCGSLDVIRRVCEGFPALPFVLAHPGANKEEYLGRLALVKELPNLHLDLSGSGVMRYGMVRRGIDDAGAGKLLFGTDFPICNPAMYVHGVLFESLSDDERTAIFSGNFRRLTGIA